MRSKDVQGLNQQLFGNMSSYSPSAQPRTNLNRSGQINSNQLYGAGGNSSQVPSVNNSAMYGSLYKDTKAAVGTSIKGNAYKNTNYSVTFRVQKKVNPGETLCVMGSLPELGAWKEYKHQMKRLDGDFWESITPLSTT